jgi:hypothetical protein
MVRPGTATSGMDQTCDYNRYLDHNSNLQLGGGIAQEKVRMINSWPDLHDLIITGDLYPYLTVMGL